MKSKLRELRKKLNLDIKELRESCSHKEKYITIREDRGAIGGGSSHPSIHVVCTNCGTLRLIFGLDKEQRAKVKKTMKAQFPEEDERLNCFTMYDWELDEKD